MLDDEILKTLEEVRGQWMDGYSIAKLCRREFFYGVKQSLRRLVRLGLVEQDQRAFWRYRVPEEPSREGRGDF